MGDACNLVRQSDSNALAFFQDPIVSRLQLLHLLHMSLLDGEDVVPLLPEDCRQLKRPTACL